MCSNITLTYNALRRLQCLANTAMCTGTGVAYCCGHSRNRLFMIFHSFRQGLFRLQVIEKLFYSVAMLVPETTRMALRESAYALLGTESCRSAIGPSKPRQFSACYGRSHHTGRCSKADKLEGIQLHYGLENFLARTSP